MSDSTQFLPDSVLVDEVAPSPNHGEREGRLGPDMIVLHYTGMADCQAALAILRRPGGGVSSHYVVPEDGRIIQCVPEARRAWHAGVSSWEGESDINSRSVGIEIVNPGHDLGYPDFPPAQIAAVIRLCADIVARHAIRPDRVVAHSDVAPSRKRDPGEKFPWRQFHENGVAHWVEPAAISPGPTLAHGECGPAVAELQTALAAYGYLVPTTGTYDSDTQIVVEAFQRHFRPARVDGVADASTIDTLERLLKARNALGSSPSPRWGEGCRAIARRGEGAPGSAD